MSIRRRVLLTGLLTGLLAAPALSCVAADAPPARLRGTVRSVTGTYFWIDTRGGKRVEVAVPDKTPISIVAPARIEDIKPNSYIGTAAMPQPDGTLRALEVHVFPEDLRGLGQGHYPWDLQPESTMTNGTVGRVEGTSGRTLTVIYHGGTKTVVVPPDVPIVTYTEGSMASLVPGAHVIVAAEPSTDGVLRARRIVVGQDGMAPPM